MPTFIPYIGNIPNDDNDLMATWTQACTNGWPMVLEPKTYRPTVPQVFDLGLCRTNGITMKGQGQQRSIIDTTGITVTDAAVQFINSSGTGTLDNYYLVLEDFGIFGNNSKTLLRCGKRDYSDPLNETTFNRIWVGGTSVDSNAVAVEMNYVCNGDFKMVVNCNNQFWGTSLRLRQAVFNQFVGSYSNCATAVAMIDGYTYGNVFSALDLEQAQVCVSIDSPHADNNTFIGGQYSYKYFGLRGTNGSNNRFINPHPQPLPSAIAWMQSSVGIIQS